MPGVVLRVANHARTALTTPLPRAVAALGITQIIGWGTTYYALSVVAKPIADTTGWGLGQIYGGLTLALLASGVASMPTGRWLDRAGGRSIMTIGSGVVAAALFVLAKTTALSIYLAAWCIMGVAMRMVLYDAAFATVVGLSAARGRQAISVITLFGGVASSIMWPIGAAIEASYGWRTTFLVYAALNLCICLPLHWFGLQVRPTQRPDVQPVSGSPTADTRQTASTASAEGLTGPARRLAMVLFGAIMSASGLVTGAVAVHMVGILSGLHIEPRFAVWLASLQGVSQTLARLVDLVYGKRLSPLLLGRATLAAVALSLLIPAAGYGWTVAVAFVALFGAANGLTTIVRGTVPLALFGPHGYGEVLGKLAIPVLAANAAAPTLLALLTEHAGQNAALLILCGISSAAWLGMMVLGNWYDRQAT